MKIDYLIKNGTIIDGSGDARFEADLLVHDDRIISIFKKNQKSVKIHDENYYLNDLSFKNVIDATSHIIAPGFIDVHTHIQSSWLSVLAPRHGPDCAPERFTF